MKLELAPRSLLMGLGALAALDADLGLPRRNPSVAVALEAREFPSAVEHAARLAEEISVRP
jgi:hypothetical protein